MTQFQNKSFSVVTPGTQQYRDNWDAIFGPKPELSEHDKKCLELMESPEGKAAVAAVEKLFEASGAKKQLSVTLGETAQVHKVEIDLRNDADPDLVAKRTADRLIELASESTKFVGVDRSAGVPPGALVDQWSKELDKLSTKVRNQLWTEDFVDAGPTTLQAENLARHQSEIRKQVTEFKYAVGQPVHLTPRVPPRERVQFCLRLIAEEFCELLEASGCWYDVVSRIRGDVKFAIEHLGMEHFDLVAVTDANADIDYTVEGYRDECGVNGAPVADEVHRANMSKMGEDGKPIKNEFGKTLKGPNYSPPDVAGELRKQGWTE